LTKQNSYTLLTVGKRGTGSPWITLTLGNQKYRGK
jgi:hypothetical protein